MTTKTASSEPEPEMITVAEFAKRTGLSRQRVWGLVNEGRIKGVQKFGTRERTHLILIPWPTQVEVANESRRHSAAMKATG
tara:strand:- start:303 stop:545 length:243 start_codon:yes stop_codon:yes gene_type:complete